MTTWKFRFDGSYTGNFYRVDTPLGVTFSRGDAQHPTPTVDPLGDPVSAGVPRFDHETLIARVGADTQVTDMPESRVLATGLGPDGSIPMMLFQNDDQGKLVIYYVDSGGIERLKTTNLTLYNLNEADGAPPTAWGFHPIGLPSWRQMLPQSAAIVHGMVIVGGAVIEDDPSTNPLKKHAVGWGFAICTNATAGPNVLPVWNVVWSKVDSSSDPDFGHFRGREWCVHASLARNRNSHPLECWTASTDYRVQRNATTPPPHGGRVFLTRFKRPNTSSSAWSAVLAGSPGVGFNFEILPGTDSTLTGCHLHTSHVAEYGENGLQMIVSVGDAQPHSRFVRLTIPDLTSDESYYIDASHWHVDAGSSSTPPNGFHGYRQTESLGSRSQQPVGVALGPRANTTKPFGTGEAIRSTLLWGVDEQSELLTRMVLPEPSDTPDQLWVEHLHGFATGFGSNYDGPFDRHRALIFALSQARPEDSTSPIVAFLGNAGDYVIINSQQVPRVMTRVLYCPNPQDSPQRWMQLASRWGTATGTGGVYNSNLYYCAYGDGVSSSRGLRRLALADLDTTTVFRPIIVAPGGKNLVVQSCYVDQGEQALDDNIKGVPQAIPPHGPTFPVGVDTLPDLTIRYLPPAPCVSARILRVRTQRTVGGTAPNRFICRVHLSGTDAQNWNDLPTGERWVTGSLVRRIRCWVLDGTWGVLTGANGQSYPNKTAQLSMRTRTGFDDFENPPIPQGAPLLYSCSNRWCPVTIIGFREIPNDLPEHKKDGISIELLCASDSEPSHPPDDNYLYLAIDGAFDGNGSLPYPIALSQAGTAPDEKPPELLTLELGSATGGYPLSFGSSWTLKLAGQVPIGNWDQYADRVDENDNDARYWPLATLWSDADNWIELIANCKDKSFQLRYKSGSSDPASRNFGEGDQLWLPDSTLMVAISWDATNKRLYFGASLAGGIVAIAPDDGILVQSWNGQTAPLSQLRFRGAQEEVVEFRWIGGEFSDQPMTSTEIKASAFSSIDFMKGPQQ